ncbi:uncharacterized protein LOC126835427 [Adelges cooleyi]|uniref:uncharacterized protein LOC126835427 n=1 Tax=Adelges cooleyi TaxID=133065 RepID=UPI00217FDF79|nr:uncharacterized protein LOC126835427 [Adelges cooleyi]
MAKLHSTVVFAALMMCVNAQRPFYASGNSYPSVLPQNQPNNSDLNNRFGESSTTESYKQDIVPGYNVDRELVDRIKNEYPTDKQPFWYVNAAYLNSSRYPQQPLPAQSPSTGQVSVAQTIPSRTQSFQTLSTQSLSLQQQQTLLERLRQQEMLIEQQRQLILLQQQNTRNPNSQSSFRKIRS